MRSELKKSRNSFTTVHTTTENTHYMNVIGVVLGGGTGSRLQPLTVSRSKPAVPLAGKYRLVDVPISNCIISNIKKIYLLTQFNSGSLHHHIQSTYQFDQFTDGYVQLLAAEQTPQSPDWFQGTADAVRQSMHHLANSYPDIVVILSGDQLFRMDFQQLIRQHMKNRADVTISTTAIVREEAAELGILKVNDDQRVTHFVEKPGHKGLTRDLLAPMFHDRYLASMGIYVFNYPILEELLATNCGADFGRHIIPRAIESHKVYSEVFDGYWKDIGTIRSFWKANLELTHRDPPFSFYDDNAPIYTRPRFLPPSQLDNCTFEDCLLSEGVVITGSEVCRSVIGLRSIINEGSSISHSILMGNDYFETTENRHHTIPLGIGRNCRIENAIIDKNVRIGENVTISPFGLEECSTDLYWVKDGIIVVPKGVTIPDSTIIGGLPSPAGRQY
jgi:glucose-1-phosphate adenylyltransferase